MEMGLVAFMKKGLIFCQFGWVSRLWIALGQCDIILNRSYVSFGICVLRLLSNNDMLLVRAIGLAIASWQVGLVMISLGIMAGDPEVVLPCSAACLGGNEDDCTATVVGAVVLVTVGSFV